MHKKLARLVFSVFICGGRKESFVLKRIRKFWAMYIGDLFNKQLVINHVLVWLLITGHLTHPFYQST